ncbi:MAG TPA: DHA2 family efflux MFS transporter permease subunit [Galbitalea sp.]|nr:DHA2 family efflux MFS transporter permease subunit [Galbitalea sp.]
MTITETSPAIDTAPSGRRRIPVWLAILAASIPMFMASLDNLVMTNALPVIHKDLGASVEQLQWFVNAYTLSFATFILLSVALGDRFGRRTVFAIGITVFTLASIAAGFSTDPGQLIAARAVQGVGGAALMPLSLTLLAGSVAPRLRPLAIGIWGGVAGLGVALGPLIGGSVVQGWDWQAIFWINVPVGLISVPLVLIALPNSFGDRVRADIFGVILVGIGVLGIVFGIVRGNDAGWDSAQVLTGLIGGAVAIIVFVWWETRSKAPLIPLRLFRDRSFSIANIVGFGFSFGMFGAVFILIQFLQVVKGASPLDAAIQTTPWTMAPMIVAPLAGIIAPRVGTRVLITVGLACQSIALFWLAATMSATVAYTTMLFPFILAGIGMGLVFSPSSTAVLATMREQDRAKASGVNSTVREIGVALGIAVLVAVFTGANGQLTPTGYVSAAIPAVLVGAAVVAATAIASLALPSGRLPRKSPA